MMSQLTQLIKKLREDLPEFFDEPSIGDKELFTQSEHSIYGRLGSYSIDVLDTIHNKPNNLREGINYQTVIKRLLKHVQAVYDSREDYSPELDLKYAIELEFGEMFITHKQAYHFAKLYLSLELINEIESFTKEEFIKV